MRKLRKLTNSDIKLAAYTIAILVGNIFFTRIAGEAFPGAPTLFLLATGLSIGYLTGLWHSGKL